jgi:hypothetical protein
MQKGSSLTLKKLILKYLDVLHIRLDQKIRMLSIQSSNRISETAVNKYNNSEFAAMKIIGDASVKTRHILTTSEMNDFLTILANSMNVYSNDKDYDNTYIDNIVFTIYKDLTENYSKFKDSLKLIYPKIILDVVSILLNKEDTKGRKIGVYGVLNYYEEKKNEYYSYYDEPNRNNQQSLRTTASKTRINSKAIKIDSLSHPAESKDKNIRLLDDDNSILGSLIEITGRNRKGLNSSLRSLSDIDLKRLKDLCNNYDRLMKYCKLAINEEEFRKEAEKDTGKRLGDNQLYHAVSSVKKVKIYVENVLDHKFEPDESHGINHIKHNLEYGYLLIGLIESSRKLRRPY